jgi:F0F1-type ATP synthase assembly protein I
MRGNQPSQRETAKYFALAQVGLEMVVPIAVGLWLDEHLGWKPWGVVGGAVLGLVGGLLHLLALLRRFEQDESSSGRDSP